MKKILSMCMILGAAVLFTACAGEEDDLFDKSAAERLNEMRDIYSARLEAQPAGWAMQYYPTDEEDGYLILADFNADHSVKVAMRNVFTNYQYKECTSVWDVITDNGPVLSFNTYNDLFHIFSDPSDTWGGDTGTGIGGDYEFVVVDAPEDASYMMLKGKKRGTYTLLTPLEQGTDFETYLEDINNFQNTRLSPDAQGHIFIKKLAREGISEQSYNVELQSNTKAVIWPTGTDEVIYGETEPFLTTMLNGKYYLRFRDEISVGDGEMVREFVYDEAADKFVSTNDVPCEIVPSDAVEFLKQTWEEDEHVWYADKNDENSAQFQELINTASSVMTSINKKYFIEKVWMTKGEEPGTSELYFHYVEWKDGQAEPKQKARYKFSYQINNGQLVYQFIESLNDQSENIRTRAGITELVNAFNGTFSITPGITGFDLSQIRLTSASNPNLWFIINY